jgi:type I restriction enzyme S subunit
MMKTKERGKAECSDTGESEKGETDMSEWRKCKLGDVISLIGGGTPKTSISEYWNGDIPWLSVVDFNTRNKFVEKTEKTITQSGLENSSTKMLNVGDIVISARGTVGAMAVLRKPMAFNQSCYGLRSIPDISCQDYLYYLTNDSILYFQQIAHGGVFDTITRETFDAIPILLPPLPEQRAIAGVLSSLDDKIDLLHRQNKTLEAMAETLFRQWFVEEEDEGWEEGTMADLCSTITKGTTPTTLGHSFTDLGINFIKAESITDIGNFIWDKFAKISPETHALLSRSIIQSGDVLCSIAGTIGRIAITLDEILPANTNQAISIIRANPQKCFPEFLYLFLKSSQFREIMDGKIVHAVQPNLSLGEIGNTPIKIPSMVAMRDFKQIIEPIFTKKKRHQNQIRTLEKLRDTLLPKLMSGEARVAI